MTCVRLAIPGASVGRWCGRAPSSVRSIAESRLGTFGNRGNGHYRTELRKASASITRYWRARISSRKSALCCGSMGNMVRGPFSLIWLASRL